VCSAVAGQRTAGSFQYAARMLRETVFQYLGALQWMLSVNIMAMKIFNPGVFSHAFSRMALVVRCFGADQ
jgi:hypothetical protein